MNLNNFKRGLSIKHIECLLPSAEAKEKSLYNFLLREGCEPYFMNSDYKLESVATIPPSIFKRCKFRIEIDYKAKVNMLLSLREQSLKDFKVADQDCETSFARLLSVAINGDSSYKGDDFTKMIDSIDKCQYLYAFEKTSTDEVVVKTFVGDIKKRMKFSVQKVLNLNYSLVWITLSRSLSKICSTIAVSDNIMYVECSDLNKDILDKVLKSFSSLVSFNLIECQE